MQHIRIYPGTLKFILVKISLDSVCLHDKNAKENKLVGTKISVHLIESCPNSEKKKKFYSGERTYVVIYSGILNIKNMIL